MIRAEARAALWRTRELIAAMGVAALGLWFVVLGGFLLLPIGVLAVALAVGWGVIALRRLRFAQTGLAPGVVEVLEGQVSYYGPAFGGAVSLSEVEELRLVTAGGRRLWRLRQNDGQTLLIPVEAVGGEALFDAFSGLPGLDTQALVAALNGQVGKSSAASVRAVPGLASQPDSRVIWRRAARAVLT